MTKQRLEQTLSNPSKEVEQKYREVDEERRLKKVKIKNFWDF